MKGLTISGDDLTIYGATRVVSSSQTQAVIETTEGGILVTGSDIEVKKLDLEGGEVLFSGKFSALKFGLSTGKKAPLLKRIFK